MSAKQLCRTLSIFLQIISETYHTLTTLSTELPFAHKLATSKQQTLNMLCAKLHLPTNTDDT